MGFLAKNAPMPAPIGGKLPAEIRETILGWLKPGIADPEEAAWEVIRDRQGYASESFAFRDIRERFGDAAVDRMEKWRSERLNLQRVAAAQAAEKARLRIQHRPQPAHYSRCVIWAGPEAFFFDALEVLIERWRGTDDPRLEKMGGYRTIMRLINDLFTNRGIPYRVVDDEAWNIEVEWTDEPDQRRLAIDPALHALQDPRLAGAQHEFAAALRHIRVGTTKELEDAVEEVAKSVESTMKVLLADKGVALPKNPTATPLFGALRTSGVVPAETDHAVLAAARIRNAQGGHGAGSAPRQVPEAIAQLAVRSAAVAITYLHSHLS